MKTEKTFNSGNQEMKLFQVAIGTLIKVIVTY